MTRRPRVAHKLTRPASARSTIVRVLASFCLAAVGVQAGDSEQQEAGTVIEAGSQVGIESTLTLEDGTKVDSNVGGEALRFEQGAGQIIPGLDGALIGMALGDFKQVTVSRWRQPPFAATRIHETLSIGSAARPLWTSSLHAPRHAVFNRTRRRPWRGGRRP